ncbi:MAG: hypothetical protein PHI12_05830 [Dehalococcoidales bacterium]|nr:hypothetical protein [Dehalococcoidales bacterium]
MKRIFIAILVICGVLFIYSIVSYSRETLIDQEAVKSIYGYIEKWDSLLSLLATVILAFAAFWVISDTRHFRYLDDKTKAISDLNEWTATVIRHLSIPMRQANDNLQLKKHLLDSRAELVNSVATSISVFEVARRLTDNLDTQTRLEINKAIGKADTELRDYIDKLFRFDINTATLKDIDQFTDNVISLTDTLRQLLEVSSKI